MRNKVFVRNKLTYMDIYCHGTVNNDKRAVIQDDKIE
jgi:hypothetical protein